MIGTRHKSERMMCIAARNIHLLGASYRRQQEHIRRVLASGVFVVGFKLIRYERDTLGLAEEVYPPKVGVNIRSTTQKLHLVVGGLSQEAAETVKKHRTVWTNPAHGIHD